MNESVHDAKMTHLLVVEDEGIVAKDLQSRLQTLGYHVPVTVSTGEAAIDAAERNAPDLVLMDIMLRGDMDGVTAAEQIRTRFDIPVIYLTAYSDENTLRRAKVTEPFGYILKPFAERELLTSIEMALYKHSIDSRLRQHQQWLSTTLHSIGDAVISTDPDECVRFMNAVAERLTGWTQEEALGKRLVEVYQTVRPPADEGNADRVDGGDPIFLRGRNGTLVPIDESTAPIRDEKSRTMGIVLVFRDVSERQMAQSELRRQRDLYESLLRAQSDLGEGILIAEGERIAYVNNASMAIAGYEADELLAMPTMGVLVVPEERSALRERIQRRMAGRPNADLFETAIFHKSGRRVELEVAVKQLTGRAAAGHGTRVVAIIRDITERKRAQAELLQTQLRLATLLKNLPSIVLYETGGGREFISENIEQLLGYPVAKFVEDRNTFPSIMHPDDAKAVKQALLQWHASNEPGVLTYQFRARHADGSYIWLEDHMVEVKPRDGDKYMSGVMIDITERKRAEEELRRAKEKAEEYDRLKTNFISVISHEIRTPLNAILGCTKLVHNAVHEAQDGPLEEGLREYFAIVDRSGDRLMKLIESFLDIASIQAGNLKLKTLNIPVEPVVRQAVDELRLKIKESNLTLVEQYEAAEAFVELDAERLSQIITNVLANAVKFTPRGSIAVRTKRDGETVAITIEDTGIGISSAFLPNMFTPFRQGSEGSTRGYQGAGLGLSIAHKLSEAMGGTIHVASTEGKGTTFTIRFPLVAARREEPPARPAGTAPLSPTRAQRVAGGPGRRALVVEDDYENMMYVRTVLRTTGWTVATATNGDDALRLMIEEPPHIVLMDINLIGGMNGFETLKEIRKDSRFASIPILAVTAHAFEEERQRILAAGFDDYLAKPFTPDQMRDLLAKHLVRGASVN